MVGNSGDIHMYWEPRVACPAVIQMGSSPRKSMCSDILQKGQQCSWDPGSGDNH